MLSLCSGIDGIGLAAKWAGIETVGFCEIEAFPQAVLRNRFPGKPVFEDLRKLNKQLLIESGVIGNGRTIDLICAGYPCQPFSSVGKRLGAEDERHLWPEVFRLIREVRPTWFLGENVAGHISMGLDEVLADLESEGYQTRTFVLPANSVGAPHERERVFIIGYTDSKPKSQTNTPVVPIRSEGDTRKNATWVTGRSLSPSYWDLHQSPIPGVDDGIPYRVERSKAAGNAVVPQQIYPVLKSIKEIHDMLAGSGT
jgi:DNA (cytosine-5)-methyltransferase 1